MKKILILFGLLLNFIFSAFAITYEDVINNLRITSNFKNIQAGDTIVPTPILIGNIFQLENANVVLRQNQIGGEQTEYYGNQLFEQMKQLPIEEIVTSYVGEGVVLAVYARPTQNNDLYDMLIMYDSAAIGLSCAIEGQIPPKTYEMLQNATISYDGYGNLGLYTKMIGFGAHY